MHTHAHTHMHAHTHTHTCTHTHMHTHTHAHVFQADCAVLNIRSAYMLFGATYKLAGDEGRKRKFCMP